MSKPLFKSDLSTQSFVTITQTALSCGIGLLLASKLRRNVQRNTAITLLSVGALTTLPLVYDVVSRFWLGPTTKRGMRKTLESIRDDSGISDDANFL